MIMNQSAWIICALFLVSCLSRLSSAESEEEKGIKTTLMCYGKLLKLVSGDNITQGDDLNYCTVCPAAQVCVCPYIYTSVRTYVCVHKLFVYLYILSIHVYVNVSFISFFLNLSACTFCYYFSKSLLLICLCAQTFYDCFTSSDSGTGFALDLNRVLNSQMCKAEKVFKLCGDANCTTLEKIASKTGQNLTLLWC